MPTTKEGLEVLPQIGAEQIILQATVGSTAYGLAREGSDIDTLGVYAAPSQAFWALSQPTETQTTHDPADATFHEIGKYLRLALKCNPTLVELLWLDEDLYGVVGYWGKRLLDIREAFLSEEYVRAAFGGYARQQLDRLVRRTSEGKEGFSSDTAKRTAKHARHCFRLLRQGRELLTTGHLTVRVENPEEYWEFDAMSVDDIVHKFTEEDVAYRATESILPREPRYATVERFLHQLRWDYL